jgi:TAG lipase/steryl ester hydrolase/phospholipase A2/LPA acyltransferase
VIGIFDSVSLIVKEPDGKFRPENEWTRQGMVDADAASAAKMASYSDGSLESDLPMQQLSELFNVNHFIVSQVNPHSAILSSMAWRASVWSNPFYRTVVGYARFLKDQCRDWLKNIVGLFIFRSNAPAWSAKRGLAQTLTQVRDPARMLSFVHLSLFLSQEYEGREMDVTIMPWAGHISAFTALTSAIKARFDKTSCILLHF